MSKSEEKTFYVIPQEQKDKHDKEYTYIFTDLEKAVLVLNSDEDGNAEKITKFVDSEIRRRDGREEINIAFNHSDMDDLVKGLKMLGYVNIAVCKAQGKIE